MNLDFYAAPGPFTELTDDQIAMVRQLDPAPVALCRLTEGLLVSPPDAVAAGVSEQRMAESNIRPASALLRCVLELDGAPLDEPRPADQRVVGTCRHFAVMATAFLRTVGVAARARCGFAAYFVAPQKVDHWIVEYWSVEDARWIRIDPEYVGRDTPGAARVADLRPGEFLTAGEAWQLIRAGRDDPASLIC